MVYGIPFEGNPILNHESVGYKWFSVEEIKHTLKKNPQTFGAAWYHVFKNIFPEIYQIT
ncbi:MAG: hypothetical protein WCG44_00275 [bacterium]